MNAETLQENPKMLIKGLGKEYGSVTALEPSNLTVHTGEFVTLLGPSGSGKTTLLQMISGLVEPTHGQLWEKLHPHGGEQTRHGFGVTALRAVSAHDGQ